MIIQCAYKYTTITYYYSFDIWILSHTHDKRKYMYTFDANSPKIELHSIPHYKNSLWVSQKKYYR